ncbi:hypothetical protein QAD02_011596 [Eretmocerus hayati]|uniref:Uncharacterized protein n=1 Tax=Eretmocerus hayati TaxID=131215 RepID=A0ACC2P218_9HYME|nr:hypothetical protein QAD02_011596 [Eretmocerus hayati]
MLHFAKMTVILGIVCASVVQGTISKEKIRTALGECLEEYNITEDEFNESHNDLDKANRSIVCVGACATKQLNLFRDDGTIIMTNEEEMPKEVVRAIQKCFNFGGKDLCETYRKTMSCAAKTVKKIKMRRKESEKTKSHKKNRLEDEEKNLEETNKA